MLPWLLLKLSGRKVMLLEAASRCWVGDRSETAGERTGRAVEHQWLSAGRPASLRDTLPNCALRTDSMYDISQIILT